MEGKHRNLSATPNDITSGVSQGSALGLPLFPIYVSDLQHALKTLDSIVFTDDRNLFYSHQDISTLFSNINVELKNIEQWFKASKLVSSKTWKA